MKTLLILTFLFMGFYQKWYIPQGLDETAGKIQILDTDRDGNLEFVFTTYSSWPSYIHFYELHLPDVWEVDSVLTPGGDLLWDSGDFDVDGLYDLAMQCGNISPYWSGISIIESPDSFSYPTEEVWRDTVGQAVVQPISAYDIDQDGIPELITNNGDPPNWLWIYESTGDNQYDTVFTSNPDTANIDGPVSTHAFGDFDSDGKIEFVVGGMSAGALGATYWVYESPANNTYERTVQGYLPTKNIKDCFSVPDADGDGKMEFVVKGFTFPDGKFQVFIFEATGDNTYEIIDTLIFTGFSNGYYGGYSASGDVDGDGKPEIALEGSYRVYMIEADTNNNFYVFDTLSGNGSGSSVAIYDIDGNGLSEVVISGNNETRIYEYVPEGVEEKRDPRHKTRDLRLLCHPNPFSTSTTITFFLPSAQGKDLKLNIYDVSGRLVRNLVTSDLCSGALMWDGRDEKGKAVRSGIYFIKLKVKTEELNPIRKKFSNGVNVGEVRKVIKLK